MCSGTPWHDEQLHARGVGGLEHAVAVGGEQRHRNVVEQVLVTARGAHQVAMKGIAFHGIGNDARQHAGVDAALFEVVLRAFAHGAESLLVVVGPGENDDGREIRHRAQRAQGLQSARIRETEVEEDQVVLDLLQPLGGVGRGLHPVTGDVVESGILQMPFDDARIGRRCLRLTTTGCS